MDSKHKKFGIVVGALAAIYFSPTLIRSAQQLATAVPFIGSSHTQKPLAAASTAAIPAPPPSSTQPVTSSIGLTRVSGTWRGGSLVANRGRCEINLEITPDAVTPARYSGALITH